MPALPVSCRSERLSFRLKDGDTLLGRLDQRPTPRPNTPLVILIHGLTGSEESRYMLSQARLLLERGYRVLRLNLRGAGPSRALCSGHYYAGRSADFRELLAALPSELTGHGLMAVGYSLGGAMLLKYLGEEGTAAPLVAAASVSVPIDLSATCRNMMRRRNRLYHRHILGEMKREATGEGALLSPKERAGILGARTIWQYDQNFIAPRHGFDGAEDYYERCKPVRFMPGIRVPTLVLASLDDPWIPGALYGGYDWRANPALKPLLTRQGGHVGFHGIGHRQPWSDLAIADFFGS
ncbi:alpha/beta fold hydrolase [Enhydrobacter sp.]|jgi:predicted alpha/beta-fold hydrolase|uniref:YheT family hydrolase n=1 Tax=Enhydrobacter sp. TaxID=1894999 RepID=UPI00260981C0|nr:alpha/beta fold hydrolase [Enhydrobacter sp.]